jgi:hypothetical protein
MNDLPGLLPPQRVLARDRQGTHIATEDRTPAWSPSTVLVAVIYCPPGTSTGPSKPDRRSETLPAGNGRRTDDYAASVP